MRFAEFFNNYLFKLFKNKFLIFGLLCFIGTTSFYLGSICVIPGEITLLKGEEDAYGFNSPLMVDIILEKDGIVKIGPEDLNASSNYFHLWNSITMRPQNNGSVSLKMKLFGLIPLKTMKVDVIEGKMLTACGNTVGVKLKMNGILVLAVSDVKGFDGIRRAPAADTGIKSGDMLVKADGKKLLGIDDLISHIDRSMGNSIKLTYKRGNELAEVKVVPVKAAEDGKYHIGLWVRDSTAGIGTLTFFEPETGYFGALGHGITDIDTGMLMPVEEGEILESSILGIKKGKQGIPGELKGVFIEDRNKLGIIEINSECGIYGKLNTGSAARISGKLYPIGIRSQVQEGPAHILSNIGGNTVQAYEVEIKKVSRQNLNGTKGMVIKVTDEKLLEATGGIVQGMSGSPIIQNERIIGAVTHVLVNDPTKGYGIFIEGMLKNLKEEGRINLEKAS